MIGNFVVDSQWSQLLKEASRSIIQSFSQATRSNINTQLKSYLLFTSYFDISPFPATSSILHPYIQFLLRSFKAVSSVQNYICGLQTVHRLKGWSFPDISSFDFKAQFKGAARQKQHTPRQAQPITPQMLEQIYSLLDFSKPFHTAVWSAFLIAFYIFARTANMVPRSFKSYDHTKQLARGDVIIAKDGLIIILKWTKTIQSRERTLVFPITAIPGSCLCPLKAFVRLTYQSPAGPDSPAFFYLHHVPNTVTQASFTAFLRDSLSQFNYQPQRYSGHSFRRAGASHAFRMGVPQELIQVQGDWASDAYKSYLTLDLLQKLKVSKIMSQNF
jgi:hypothetical protein